MYFNNMPIDTCLYWDSLGNLTSISITDSAGNGKVQEMYGSGKVKTIGRLMHGERTGRWIYKREDGSKLMDVVFMADTVFSKKCFDKSGGETDDFCYFFRPAMPSQQYRIASSRISPELAQYIADRGDGVVKYRVFINSEGFVKDFVVLYSSYIELSRHVEDIVWGSSPWLPGIEEGQPVSSWLDQEMSFRTERRN